MSREIQTLVVMRADEMTVIHPQTDFSRKCSKCGAEVGIYPSGQSVIKRFGPKNVEIVCNQCIEPELLSTSESAPGALAERRESIRNPRKQ